LVSSFDLSRIDILGGDRKIGPGKKKEKAAIEQALRCQGRNGGM
jgi:hypothetical protein